MQRSLLLSAGSLAAALSACAEPAIEMRLELPTAAEAEGFNVSCVGAVEVYVRGNDRGRFETFDDPGVPADDVIDCIEIQGADSYAAVRAAIAGRFQLELPESGLAAVDIRGSTGSCNKDNSPGDAIFYGAAEYTGGGELVIPITPNLSCNSKTSAVVRPIDLLALTRNNACPPLVADNSGGVDSATIHPTALASATLDFNGDFASIAGGVATLPLYPETDAASCIALYYWDNPDVMTASSCARRGKGVCAPAGQIELPIIDYYVAYQAASTDSIDEYGGLLIGGVWGTDGITPTSPRAKLTGATVRPANAADADQVKLVYADYPAGAASPRELPGATSTNGTGLFIAYLSQPLDFIVSAPGYADETVRMGSPDEPSTALIVLTKR